MLSFDEAFLQLPLNFQQMLLSPCQFLDLSTLYFVWIMFGDDF